MFNKVVRMLAWLCVFAIIMISLVPAEMRPHSAFSGKLEHFLAYACMGLFLGIAYHSIRERVATWVAFAVLSVVIEILQRFIPGRTPSIFDALASTGGLTLGLLFGAVASAYIISL